MALLLWKRFLVLSFPEVCESAFFCFERVRLAESLAICLTAVTHDKGKQLAEEEINAKAFRTSSLIFLFGWEEMPHHHEVGSSSREWRNLELTKTSKEMGVDIWFSVIDCRLSYLLWNGPVAPWRCTNVLMVVVVVVVQFKESLLDHILLERL